MTTPAPSTALAAAAEATKAPYGDVAYADPGLQKDKKKRYPIDTKAHAKAAWSYINKKENAALYNASQLKAIKSRIKAALKRFGVTVTDTAAEAVIDGKRTFDETRELVRDALTARIKQMTGVYYCYVYVADLTDTDVVYTAADCDDLMQCSYAIGADGAVQLGEPFEVVRTYAPAAADSNAPPEADVPVVPVAVVMESEAEHIESVAGRVIEAKGTDANGGRIFRVRIIEYGDSKNGRRYTESVMRQAVPLYEGAAAFDHHRTAQELETSTVSGLVGYYRNVEAEADGLYGDLHLLPSATHAAEALDASIGAQEENLPPVVGISHDVRATFKPIVSGGRRLQEAIQIVSVDSADIVAKPSAGGKAVRAVAGGDTEPTTTAEESDVPTKADVLAALREATDEELAEIGLPARVAKTTEAATPNPAPVRATEGPAETEPQTAREADYSKASFLGRQLIKAKVEDASLPAAVAESLTAELPDRITESDVDARIASLKATMGVMERAGLAPQFAPQVTKEALDKKIEGLDKFFSGDFSQYKSFKEAFLDFTDHRPSWIGEDVNKMILRESLGAFDSGDRSGALRAAESLSASSWNLVLGDSITRRLVAEYNNPSLQSWKSIVSSVVPVNDFRTQRIDRIGGYSNLPAVNQGSPYQPLTSPSNEEVTYAITKRGGTEDITLEMIANDDVRAISKIPAKLGFAAAMTLYTFVWDFVTTNPTIYDSTALFTGTSGHANYVNNASGTALNQSSLSAGRLLMRSQTGYGATNQFLALTPKTLVVVNDIEELGWQLVTSAVALPTAANTPPDSTGAANTPNLHQGLNLIVLDYVPNATSTTAWWLVCDPNMCPTIEVGFDQGRQDPELFTQSDPTVGSVFNADKVTYKIRHIYSGAVLDYRGMVKGN